MKTVIISGGGFTPRPDIKRLIHKAELIVCADGGARHLRALGIFPHVIIGDLDSIAEADRLFFEKAHVPFLRYPAEKDATDTQLCIEWALAKGATELTIIGATGRRMDHTLANIFLLKTLAEKKVPSTIIDSNNEIHVVIDSMVLKGKKGELLSILPLSSQVSGVSLKGLLYPLENAQIRMGESIGISNEFTGSSAEIRVKEGVLLVFKSRD